jgi:hypothetical protein
VQSAVREFAAFGADVERAESDQAAVGIAISPNTAIAELRALRDVFSQ